MTGITNSRAGGTSGEKVNIILTTNQTTHEGIMGAVVRVTVAGVEKDYTWEGGVITVAVPAYMDYRVSVSEVEGYTKPQDVESKAVQGNSATVTMVYSTTVVTVQMEDNQEGYDDIAAATATVTAGGKVYSGISGGGRVNVPVGSQCSVEWSGVEGYRTPDKQEFTARGKAVTMTGLYQTEVLTVNVTSDIDLPSEFTVTVSGIGSQTEASKVYKVPFGVEYTVSATEAAGYKVPGEQMFTASQENREVTVEYLEKMFEAPSISGVTDLSRQDIYGNPIASTTANCYVVKEAGTYAFPLVYGNAIRNGSVNAVAYTKVEGQYSMDFVNHLDEVISSPFIESHANCVAESAELSMADTSGVFSNIEVVQGVSCRYIKFNVDSAPNTGANGVLSVLDANGAVLWSWHIWVWTDDLTTVTITNNTGVKYKVLPVNLATKKDESTAGKMFNWFYQWGRHVPMMPPKNYNKTTEPTNYGVRTLSKELAASSYGMGIQNPQSFYRNSSAPYNWFGSSSYYNLWDASYTSTGKRDDNVVKTVYDPCPSGFKMPNGNTFSYLSKENAIGDFGNGRYFKCNANDTSGVFFPASGCRYYTNGNLSYVGNFGYVWLTSAASQNNAYYLYFDSSSVNSSASGKRSNAYSVRPVTDEPPRFPIENGVYIQSTDGTLYTESQWDGSKTPNGIAVVTDNCQFVMALQDAHTSSCMWSNDLSAVSGITTTTDSSEAKADYDGEAQTTTIISTKGAGYSPATDYCRTFTFPNGKKGYLGAAGEWQAALDNKAAVVASLAKCGGTKMSYYYWVSTQYDSRNSWSMYWTAGYLSYDIEYQNRYVRAFTSI